MKDYEKQILTNEIAIMTLLVDIARHAEIEMDENLLIGVLQAAELTARLLRRDGWEPS